MAGPGHEMVETMAEYRRTSEGLKTTNRETMMALAERHFVLAKEERPDEAESFIEVDTAQYLDAGLFEREKRAIFERYPVVAGLTQDMPNPGDYLKVEDKGIFVTRTKSGAAKAFINGCRHRGTALVYEERGSGKALFTCPYHGWTYEPNGKLVSVPCGDSFEGLDKSKFGLVEVPCEERHGIIFVSPRADQPLDLDKHLGEELSHEIGTWSFDRAFPVRNGPMVLDANWKLVMDTFLETYHFAAAHKDNLAMFYTSNANTLDSYGKHLRFSIALKTILTEFATQSDAERIPENYVHVAYIMFPGMIIINNAQIVQMFRIFPKSVNQTIVQFATYSRLPLDRDGNLELMENVYQNAIDIVTAQDFLYGAITSQQALETGAIKKFAFGKNELALQLMLKSIEEAKAEIG